MASFWKNWDWLNVSSFVPGFLVCREEFREEEIKISEDKKLPENLYERIFLVKALLVAHLAKSSYSSVSNKIQQVYNSTQSSLEEVLLDFLWLLGYIWLFSKD